jgi:hypothetical protein
LNTSQQQDPSKCSTDIQEVKEMHEGAVGRLAARSVDARYDAKVIPSSKDQDDMVILCDGGIYKVSEKRWGI